MALAIGRAVLLLDGDALGNFGLVLVVIDGFSIDLDGQLVGRRRLKQTGNVVGDAHEIDGRRTLVDQGHRGLNLLRPVRAEASGGVGFLNVGFEDLEFLLLEGHRTFGGLDRLGQHRVGQLVGKVGL